MIDNTMNFEFLDEQPRQASFAIVANQRYDEFRQKSGNVYFTVGSMGISRALSYEPTQLDGMISNLLQVMLKFQSSTPILNIHTRGKQLPNWLRLGIYDYVAKRRLEHTDDRVGDIILANGTIIHLPMRGLQVTGASNVTDDELIVLLLDNALRQVCDMKELESVLQLFLMNLRWMRKHEKADLLLASIMSFILQSTRMLYIGTPELCLRSLESREFNSAIGCYTKMPNISNVICGQAAAAEDCINWKLMNQNEKSVYYVNSIHRFRMEDILVPIPVGFIGKDYKKVEWFIGGESRGNPVILTSPKLT